MPPIQQIGPAAQSEFTTALYYAPPPQQPPNAFAAFWSGFLAERTPWARELFSARLRAMDPSAKAAALLALEEQATERFKAQQNAMNVAAQRQSSLWGNLLDFVEGVRGQDMDAAETRYKGEVELLKAQTAIESTKGQELDKKIRQKVQGLADAQATKGDVPLTMGEAKPYIESINDLLDDATGMSLLDRQALESSVRRSMAGSLPPGLRDATADRLNMPKKGAQEIEPTEPGAAGAMSMLLDAAGQLQLAPAAEEGTRSVRAGVRGTPLQGLMGAMGGGPSVMAAPEMGVTREDIERVFDPASTGLGRIGDPIFTREPRRARIKRETIEGMTPTQAQVFAEGVPAAAPQGFIERYLRPSVPVSRAMQQAAEATADTRERVRRDVGAIAEKPRPTLADEEIAAGIEVTAPQASPTAQQAKQYLSGAAAEQRRFERQAAKQFERDTPSPRQQLREAAWDAEWGDPMGERSVEDVRERMKDMREDYLMRFMRKRKKQAEDAAE